jgi:SNF2 family DNA or RNA helicase
LRFLIFKIILFPASIKKNKMQLRNYQIKAVQYLRRNNGGALFMDMRLGKIKCTVGFLRMRKGIKRVLIVAPYSAFDGWKEECPNITDISIHGERSNYEFQSGWYIINKEGFLQNHFLLFRWDALVIDESFITNPRAKVTKYFLNFSSHTPVRILLSGTPDPESDLQYYPQLSFLFPGVFGVKNFWEYRSKYCIPDYAGYNWKLTNKGKYALGKVLAEKCFVLTCKDVNLYPSPQYIKRAIYLSNPKIYSEAEKHCLDDLDNILKYAGQKWNYLRRLCSQSEKEEELLYLLNGELRKKQVVIWCVYIEEILRLSKLLKCPCIYGSVSQGKRYMLRHNFNAGKYRLIVVQPDTVKFGSDFSAADTEIYFSTPQSLMSRKQSEKRIINLKRKYPVLIIDLIAKNTIEEDILESLRYKENRKEQIERIRRGILRRVNRSG